MIDLDQAINQSYREASDAEAVARRLEARIEQIPGAQGLLPRRRYGTPVNFKAIQENLTLASLISRSDAALAHYCGLDASVKHRIDEQREAQRMRAEALRMQTEQLAARNQQARQDREARQSLSPWQRGYRSV